MTIDPFVRIPVFIEKLSERQYCWRVFRGLSIVKNISISLTYTIASSCVCTSPLAVMTIVGDCMSSSKYPFQHYSSPVLLIMCIDAPESTTNSRSSGLRVDAGRHLFSEGEKNVALSCSFNFNTLLASFHAASRAACSCPLCLLLRPILNISKRRGYAHEVLLGKYIRAKDFGLVNFTRWIGFCMSVHFRRIDFGGVMS